jgi:hypothetical protein
MNPDKITNIQDFLSFTTPQELIGSTNESSEGMKWAIWNLNEMTKAEKDEILNRYAIEVLDGPFLFYYCEKVTNDTPSKKVTIGIVFPISIVLKADFDEEKKTMTVHVKKSDFYWRYSRQVKKALNLPFFDFKGIDESFIASELANPMMMDSSSPNHPKKP